MRPEGPSLARAHQAWRLPSRAQCRLEEEEEKTTREVKVPRPCFPTRSHRALCEGPAYQSPEGETEAQEMCVGVTPSSTFPSHHPSFVWSPPLHPAPSHTHGTNGPCFAQSCPASTDPFLPNPLSFPSLKSGAWPTWHSQC